MVATHSEIAEETATDGGGVGNIATEAFGNFALVFTFGIAIAVHDWFAPLLIGTALMGLMLFRRRIRGGHYNPAVTLALLIRYRIEPGDAVSHWLVQLGAGMLAATSVRAIVDPKYLAVTAAMTVQGGYLVAALILELILTCALCYLALETPPGVGGAVDCPRSRRAVVGILAGGLAIGALVACALDTVPEIPDSALASSWMPTLWVFLVAQLLSGLASAVTFIIPAEPR